MKRIVILGAGESGAGAAVLAKVKGFETFVSDMSAIKDKYKELLDSHAIAWEEGHHTEELILNADEVVKSPGIPNDAPLILKLKAQGTPVISEIEFAGRYTDAKMICITGSNDHHFPDLPYFQECRSECRFGRQHRQEPCFAGSRRSS